jgi:hypothetical protein
VSGVKGFESADLREHLLDELEVGLRFERRVKHQKRPREPVESSEMRVDT